MSGQASDADLVRLALEGESEAFACLYDRYFSALYDFLRRTMRNPDDAADAVHDTFLRAMESLPTLSNPSSFKSWLFSIAHNQALNRLEREKRIAPPPAGALEGEDEELSDPLLRQIDTDRFVDPERAAAARETAALVWEAAQSLDARTYAVLDLHVRQGLESAEIAEVLGVSKGNAYTMLNRMKKSVEEAIGAFLLARQGSKECERLREVLAAFVIPPITREVRRAVDRHVRGCDVCGRTRRRLLSPLEVLGAFACVPPPAGLKERVWGELERQWPLAASSYHAAMGARTGGRGGGGRGLGTALGGRWRRWGLAGLGMAAAAAVAMTVVCAPSLWSGEEPGATATPTATSRPLRTPSATPTQTPPHTATPTPEATATARAPTPVAFPSLAPTAAVPTESPLPPLIPSVTATPWPSVTPTRTPSPSPTATATQTPQLTQTPTCTPTPTVGLY